MTTSVKCYVPNESCVIETADGHSHLVSIDEEGRRFVMLTVEAVKPFLESGLACSLPWREINAHLLGGALGPVEKPSPGISMARLQRATANAAPRDPRDVGGMANDVLRSMGRMR
jgi:hypothetical protein